MLPRVVPRERHTSHPPVRQPLHHAQLEAVIIGRVPGKVRGQEAVAARRHLRGVRAQPLYERGRQPAPQFRN